MAPLRLGFIGVGHIARRAHLPALAPLAERGEVVFQAFCDEHEERLREAGALYRVERLYTNHHEMLEREALDALFLLVPPTCHADAELIAAERGIALFVEKPQTLDLFQAYRFDEAIRRSGIVAQVGFMSRYYPSAERARELISDRLPRHANVHLFYSGAPIRYWTSRMELCGGSFVENTIHMVDLLRFFLGDIERVSAFYVDRQEGDVQRGDMNLPHAYLVNYRLANGTAANFTTSRCLTEAGVNRREFLVVCEDALIEWSASRIFENGQVLWEEEPVPNPFTVQAAAFIRAVRERDPGAVHSPYSDALNSLAAVLGANESAAANGRLVDLRTLGTQ